MSNKLLINIKHPKGEDGYKTFSVRLKNDVVEQLDKISFKTGRSRNELIGIMLDFALDNCKIEESERSRRSWCYGILFYFLNNYSRYKSKICTCCDFFLLFFKPYLFLFRIFFLKWILKHRDFLLQQLSSVKPPIYQNQHFIKAIDKTTRIIDMIIIIRDSGNRNESVSPSPKARAKMPCCL